MFSPKLSSSKGFGIIEIIVAVVVLAIIGGGVYLYVQNQSDNGSGIFNQERKALEASCRVEIDDDLLCKVFSNWGSNLSTEPYTVTTTTKGGTGEPVNMVFKSHGENSHSISTYGGQTKNRLIPIKV